MAQVLGLKELTRKLNQLARETKAQVKQSVYVGYSAAYALFVHEAVGAHFRNNKSAKYLEMPARTRQKEIFNAIANRAKKDTSSNRFQRALVDGGLMLQRLSMQIVPIDTGALRASAFTAIESKLASAIATSFARSEERRAREEKSRKAKRMRGKSRKK